MKKLVKNVLLTFIIGALTVCIYYYLITSIFECFHFNENLESKYPECNYGDYVLFEGVFRPTLYASEETNEKKLDFIIMFQWKYDELMNWMTGHLDFLLESLQEQNMISEFRVDEQAIKVDLVLRDLGSEIKKEHFYAIENEIQDICCLRYAFIYHEIIDETKSLVTLYDKAGNQIQEVPVMSQKEAEKEEEKEKEEKEKEFVKNSYNNRDVQILEKILSRSKNKTPFDFNDDFKIRSNASYGEERNIWYIDLSDYSDITGELDLSGFANLRHAKLKGMKIKSIILPSTFVSVEPQTFDDCKNLTKITIPKSVSSFSNLVFNGCKNLKEIIFEGDAPEVSWEREDIFGKVPDDLIIYRKKSARGWQEIGWDKYDVRIIDE